MGGIEAKCTKCCNASDTTSNEVTDYMNSMPSTAEVEVTDLNVPPPVFAEVTEIAEPAPPPIVETVLQPKVKETSPLENSTAEAQATDQPASGEKLDESFCEFTITIVRDSVSEPWGIGLRKSKNADQVVIRAITGKFLNKWQVENPTKQVARGDQIVAVNGQNGTVDELVELLKQGIEVRLTLRRQLRISVNGLRTPLGLGLDSESMVVSEIRDGMVNQYNQNCLPNTEIFPGDRLVLAEVNGEKLEIDTMIDQLARIDATGASDVVALTFARTPHFC